MKHKLHYAFVLFSALMCNEFKAQTTVYSETFTGGLPAGWQKNDLSPNNAGNWQYTATKPLNWTNHGWPGTKPVMTTSSTGYMLFDSNGQNAGTNDNKPEKADLISPAINLSGKTNSTLIFEHFNWHVDSDTATIWVSTDGSNFTQVWKCDDLSCSNGVGSQYGVSDTINISSIADNQPTVYIKFRWVGDYDMYWAIDDIKITANAATGINENATVNDLIIYENPINSLFHFNLNTTLKEDFNVSIIDISGKMAKEQLCVNGHNTIDVTDLSKGLYFMRIYSNNFLITKKIVKN